MKNVRDQVFWGLIIIIALAPFLCPQMPTLMWLILIVVAVCVKFPISHDKYDDIEMKKDDDTKESE